MNKHTRLTVLALCLLATLGVARAADWTEVAQASPEARTFVDASSIRDVSGIRTAWVKIVPGGHAAGSTPAATADSRQAAYFAARMEFNCAEQTYRRDVMIAYYDDGTHGTSTVTDSEAPWIAAAAGSAAGAELALVCAHPLR